MPLDIWDSTLDINLRAPLLCGRQAAVLMKKRGGGRIVNIASVHAVMPRRGHAHYATAKAGLVMLTQSMATEWAEHNIQVNYVSPGAISTSMTDSERQALLNPIIPAARCGRPDEIAAMVHYLLSDEASYITGSGITVDGGLTLGFSANDKG
jgi:NAD(P)-dependent dehydrogenase (short-subunit alcohol dehydrogenase family)